MLSNPDSPPMSRPHFSSHNSGGPVCTAPALAASVANLLGFGAAGPVAGGIAAAAQSTVGNVAASSTFALTQSIAMKSLVATAAGSAVALPVTRTSLPSLPVLLPCPFHPELNHGRAAGWDKRTRQSW